jgi:hypothetical protein
MKKLLVFAIALFLSQCSPTAPAWFEGDWFGHTESDTYHLIISKSSLWCARHINGEPRAVVYSKGALADQVAYADSLCAIAIDTSTYSVDITKVGDSLELTGNHMAPIYFTR